MSETPPIFIPLCPSVSPKRRADQTPILHPHCLTMSTSTPSSLLPPSSVAAKLLANVDSELASDLASIEHSGTAILSLGYASEQIGHPLDGMGAVVPTIERSPILACSFSSRKYPHRTPPGKELLRVFVGGARHPELAEMPDAELCPMVLAEVKKLFRHHRRRVLHQHGPLASHDAPVPCWLTRTW